MIVFPNCKINLGLQVTGKRPDGFHNLSTVFYPVNWCDIAEVKLHNGKEDFKLLTSGLTVSGSVEDNILFKTHQLIKRQYTIPPVEVFLHKQLPMGAGLGGGSADAVFFMKALIQESGIVVPEELQLRWAEALGSDCPFFVHNVPVYAQGRGEVVESCNVNLDAYAIVVVYPGIHSNTKDAFDGIVPRTSDRNLKELIETLPPERWREGVVNNFETTIFKKYPVIAELKNYLYSNGAVYASLSGSGSAVYGIFNTVKPLTFPPDYLFFWQAPGSTKK